LNGLNNPPRDIGRMGLDDAAIQKMRDELLKDPEFLKAAIETVRNGNGQQQGQQGQRPNNVTRLPPSLSRTAGSSANADPIDTDDSDRAIFDYAFK
jgi:hypothetical protein